MKEKLQKQLIAKGWTKAEIEHAAKVMDKAEKEKHSLVKILDNSVYWLTLIVLIVCNTVLSIIIIPLLFLLNSYVLYLSTAVIALCFGFLFELVLRDMDKLENRHHVIIGVFMPGFAFLSVYFIIHAFYIMMANSGVRIPIGHPIAVAVDYAAFFIAPYLYFKHYKKMW